MIIEFMFFDLLNDLFIKKILLFIFQIQIALNFFFILII